MISEFHQLAEKVDELAALTQALRRENADLRRQAVALAAENADLSQRMDQAHARLTALLEQIPAAVDEEAA
jgi:FtsZ-binding cell division protein ZapB